MIGGKPSASQNRDMLHGETRRLRSCSSKSTVKSEGRSRMVTCNRKPTAIVTKLKHAGVNFLHNIREPDKRNHTGFAVLINGTGKESSRKQYF